MTGNREGLRPKKVEEKPKKERLSNAELCKAYRERIKQNKHLFQIARERKKQSNLIYLQNLTPEKKLKMRENAKLRQRRRRQRLKQAILKSNSGMLKPNSQKSKASVIKKEKENERHLENFLMRDSLYREDEPLKLEVSVEEDVANGVWTQIAEIQDSHVIDNSLSLRASRPDLVSPNPNRLTFLEEADTTATPTLVDTSEETLYAKKHVIHRLSRSDKKKGGDKVPEGAQNSTTSSSVPVVSEDEHDMFARTLALKMRKLTRDQCIHAEKLINEVIYEASFDNLSRASHLQVAAPTPVHYIYRAHAPQFEASNLHKL